MRFASALLHYGQFISQERKTSLLVKCAKESEFQPPFCVEPSRHCVLHVIIELKQAAFLSDGHQPEVIVAFQLTSDVSGLRGQQSASERFSCMC